MKAHNLTSVRNALDFWSIRARVVFKLCYKFMYTTCIQHIYLLGNCNEVYVWVQFFWKIAEESFNSEIEGKKITNSSHKGNHIHPNIWIKLGSCVKIRVERARLGAPGSLRVNRRLFVRFFCYHRWNKWHFVQRLMIQTWKNMIFSAEMDSDLTSSVVMYF